MDEQNWKTLKFWAGGRWADLARSLDVSSELIRQWRKGETPVAAHQLEKMRKKYPQAFKETRR